jgi:hypothetical protein
MVGCSAGAGILAALVVGLLVRDKKDQVAVDDVVMQEGVLADDKLDDDSKARAILSVPLTTDETSQEWDESIQEGDISMLENENADFNVENNAGKLNYSTLAEKKNALLSIITTLEEIEQKEKTFGQDAAKKAEAARAAIDDTVSVVNTLQEKLDAAGQAVDAVVEYLVKNGE